MKNKYNLLFFVAVVAIFAIILLIATSLLSKLTVPLSVVLVVAGLVFISKYYPTKKEIEEEKKKKEKEEKEKEKLKLVLLAKEKKAKEKTSEDFIAIDIKTTKDEKTKEDKIIAIDLVEVKDNKVEKEAKAYIKQDNVSDKTLFNSSIPKQEYVKASDEKTVMDKVIKSFPKLKDDRKTVIVDSPSSAKALNKHINKGNSSNTTYIVPGVSTKTAKDTFNNTQENKSNRPVNAKKLANNYLSTSDKKLKESKIEKPTEKEKVVCAYIKNSLKDKEDVKFSKDKDGYINVIGKNNRVRLKVDKDKNYVVLPKEDADKLNLEKEECNEKEEKESNVRVVFNKIKDILLVKTGILNKLKRKKIIQEKVEEYNFNISYAEAKKIIKIEEENKKLLEKLEKINKNANIYHNSQDYKNELKTLNKGINKLKGKGINITNLVIRKNNLLKFLSEQQEKQKKLEKKPKDN